MSTGDFEGLQSSGKGLGMDGTEEDNDSTPFALEKAVEMNKMRQQSQKQTI